MTTPMLEVKDLSVAFRQGLAAPDAAVALNRP